MRQHSLEVEPLLGFVLGFVQVADGAEAVTVSGISHGEAGKAAEQDRQLWN
jgi:hypothetical protein